MIIDQQTVRSQRKFLPSDLKIDSWQSLESFFTNLQSRELTTFNQLASWLSDLSELETVVQEHVGWLYIRMTCDTKDEKLTEAYTFFINEINPQIGRAHV